MKYLPLIPTLSLILAFATACSSSDEATDAPSKEEVSTQLKADGISSEQVCIQLFGYECDLCEELGWYNDGICDDFCSLPDQLDCGDIDAGPVYDPCSGLSCGDFCSLCDPADPDCAETAEVKTCNEFGDCGGGLAYCDDGILIDGGIGPDSGAYDPCSSLSCGDSCSLCDPADPDCVETAEVKTCGESGQCGSGLAYCDDGILVDGGVGPDSGSYDACTGLSCGDFCTVCDPTDPDCIETAVPKQCSAQGLCVDSPGFQGCSSYDPCGGLACGDFCNVCDPADTNCVETAEVKTCNEFGQCGGGLAYCDDGL